MSNTSYHATNISFVNSKKITRYFENIGISYYSNKNYENCIQYFDKANSFAQNTAGKSYFFKAMAAIALGKKDQACSALNEAKKRAYPEAGTFIKSNCP